MATVSLIIVNYDTAAETQALLEAIGPGLHEVIVVDNASPTGGIDEAVAAHPGVRLVQRDRNGGYGTGANAGAAVATGDVLVISNPDILTSAGSILDLATTVTGDVGLAAPAFRSGDGSFQPSAHAREPGIRSTLWDFCWPLAGVISRVRPGWRPTLLPDAAHGEARDVLHVLGALMAVDGAAFRTIGGFDEDFFLYREETDLCRRLRDRGLRIRHEPSVVVTHYGDASSTDSLPVAIRPSAMASHYRYIDKHQGRVAGMAMRIVGLLGSGLWSLTGPKRRWGWATFRWHARSAWRRAPRPS